MLFKLKSYLTYAFIRSEINEKTRLLCELIVCAIATIAITFLPISGVAMIVAASFFSIYTLTVLYFYIKRSRRDTRYSMYDLYMVNKATGMIHMRYKDLKQPLAGKSEDQVKEYLINQSHQDFLDILDDMLKKGKGFRSVCIQTHKTFIRVFMQALQERGFISYSEDELEANLTRFQEDNLPEDTTRVFFSPRCADHLVKLKYLGMKQNRLLALRAPLSDYQSWKIKFQTKIPYYELDVSVSEHVLVLDPSSCQKI